MASLACAGADPALESLSIVIDSTGRYPVVRSLGAAPAWTADRLFIARGSDSVTGDFAVVRSVLLGQDGSLYVVDPRSRVIARFDSSGASVGTLGREGSGPSEFRNPYSLAWLGDTLALLDPGNARIGRFAPDGGWAGSWPVQPVTGDQMVRLYRTSPHEFWAPAYRVVNDQARNLFVRYTAHGPVDTIDYAPPRGGSATAAMCNLPGGGLRFFFAPFSSAHLTIPAPGGELAIAHTSEYRVVFQGASGDTVRVIERSPDVAVIENAEWNAATRDFADFLAQVPTAQCDRQSFSRPAAKPPLAFMFFDDEGFLWLELTTPGGTLYDVYGSDGRLRATVHGLPASNGVDPSVVNGRIALVQRDSLDVPFVEVYRLRTGIR